MTFDFTATKLLRRSQDGIGKQGLGKALGLNRYPDQNILDATAGTGADAFLMAVAGCKVTLLERSPIVHAFLSDALVRGSSSANHVADAIHRMQLLCVDFLEFHCDESQSMWCTWIQCFLRYEFGPFREAMYMLQQLLDKGAENRNFLPGVWIWQTRRVVVKRNRSHRKFRAPIPIFSLRGAAAATMFYLVKSGLIPIAFQSPIHRLKQAVKIVDSHMFIDFVN